MLLRLGACIGRTNPAGPCGDDADCPGGQCGAFTLSALDPVPLEGLNQSAALNAFVVEEAIAQPAVDLNGDGMFDETGAGERATVRVNVSSDGAQANGLSWNHLGSISADGRFVTFTSDATNLVPDDTNGFTDIFAYDRRSGQVTAVSVVPDGRLGSSNSGSPTATPNGRFVVFSSRAGNLAALMMPAGSVDVFLHDRTTRLTTRIGLTAAGETPSLATCPTRPLVTGNPDLNGDGDAADDVVHLWTGGGTENLGRAARDGASGIRWRSPPVAIGVGCRHAHGSADVLALVATLAAMIVGTERARPAP